MAKEKRVKMYNKGGRRWTFKDNGKEVVCDPGKSIELNESQAKKFVKDYPKDFLAGEPVQRTDDSKKLKARVAELEKENATLRQQIISRDEKITEFEQDKRDTMHAKKDPTREV